MFKLSLWLLRILFVNLSAALCSHTKKQNIQRRNKNKYFQLRRSLQICSSSRQQSGGDPVPTERNRIDRNFYSVTISIPLIFSRDGYVWISNDIYIWEKTLCLLEIFYQPNLHGAPPAVFWICSLRMRMLCRCSGGNIAICSGVSCRTCMIRAA